MHTIRTMNKSDLVEVLAIEQACFPRGWSHNHFLTELSSANSCCMVLETVGKVAGYFCVSFVLDEAELLNIAVAPDHQGKGLGRDLLQKACDLALEHGVVKIMLEVRASGKAALGLYKSFGFKQSGLRKNYYENNIDAVLMDKIF